MSRQGCLLRLTWIVFGVLNTPPNKLSANSSLSARTRNGNWSVRAAAAEVWFGEGDVGEVVDFFLGNGKRADDGEVVFWGGGSGHIVV